MTENTPARPVPMPSTPRMLRDILWVSIKWSLQTDHPIRCARDLWRWRQSATIPVNADEFSDQGEQIMRILMRHGAGVSSTETQRRWRTREFWKTHDIRFR